MEYGKPGTVVIKCENKCPNPFQDERYGKGIRVMNHAPSKGAQKDRYRCTSCKKEHIVRD